MVVTADALPLIADELWTVTSLTYSFPDEISDYSDGYGLLNELDNDFAEMPNASKNLFRDAFDYYASIIGLTFTEVADDEDADIEIATSTARGVAWAYRPGLAEESGDIWFNLENSVFDKIVSPPATVIGDYVWHTILHEMGHAMGLLHGHDGLDAAYDGMPYSVMTYRSYIGDPTASFYTNSPGHYAQSLMTLDIAALQSVYGANYDTGAGDSVYHFDPATGDVTRNGDLYSEPDKNVVFLTLWDGGGEDTLDFSNYLSDLSIDLTPGAGSDLDVGGELQRASLSVADDAPHHVYMSVDTVGDGRALIEHAIGGRGDDSFQGNGADNSFRGGLGRDSYDGGGGADTVLGTVSELTGDTIAGFAGEDVLLVESYHGDLSVSADFGGVDVNIAGSVVHLDGNLANASFEVERDGSATGVRLASYGAIQLTGASDRFFTGGFTQERVFGDAGDDAIGTGGGADLLSGGAGADLLLAGGGDDILIGGRGADFLTGGDGADIFAFDSSDFEPGKVSADYINDFQSGTDVIELSGFGFTTLDALNFVEVGSGHAIDLGEDRYIVLVGLTADDLSDGDIVGSEFGRDYRLVAAATEHVLTDQEDRFVTQDQGANFVYGGGGDDALVSGGGNDALYGELGADRLIGGAGADTLVGGTGSDVMTGRDGADRFEFTFGEESDIAADYLTDFTAEDTVALYGFAASSVGELTATLSASGDLALQLGSAHFLVFEGYSDASELTGTFLFL